MYIMGNTESSPNNSNEYIDQQKKIIMAQQEQIAQQQQLIQQQQMNLPQQQQQMNLPQQQENVYHHNSSIDDNNIQKNKEAFEKALMIFNLSSNYDETSLKTKWIELAVQHHPDKGGNPNNFKKISYAYKLLLKKLSESKQNHEHHELRDHSRKFNEEQGSNNMQNINLTEKFDKELFNKVYEENRLEDVFDKGYTSWIKENKVDEVPDNPEKPGKLKNGFNENTFHSEFEKKKQEQIKNLGSSIIKYEEPNVDISYKGKDALVTLGRNDIQDFSGESSGGLTYRDYKDAYTNSCLIDTESINISSRAKNIKEHTLQRKNISYSLSEEDQQKQALNKMKEEEEEKQRIQRLEKYDGNAFNTYERVHQRLLG